MKKPDANKRIIEQQKLRAQRNIRDEDDGPFEERGLIHREPIDRDVYFVREDD